jgi:hypothetical protein
MPASCLADSELNEQSSGEVMVQSFVCSQRKDALMENGDLEHEA